VNRGVFFLPFAANPLPLALQFRAEYGIGLSMQIEKKYALYIILFIFLFSLGFSLFINIQTLQKNFLFADEAIYFSMTQSLAQDGDIEYTKKDLIRYYKAFNAGPLGIFLKKGKNSKIYYAKSFAYSLFAAPFVKLFGCNGFFVFHSLILLLILLMGFYYYSQSKSSGFSLLLILTFLFASITAVYFLWMTPDFFNLFLAFCVLFLWLYKRLPHHHKNEKKPASKLETLLLSDWSDYLACLIAAIAVFSKPPVVSGIFWGANQAVTGDWNYQGGERKTFYGEGGYPLEKEHLTFDTARGGLMTSEGYAQKHLYPPKVFIYNFFYYFFGRFSGITWYFFPAVLALFLFFIRKKQLYQWFILAALAGEILIFIILMPDNYAGGGGALGNRYFLSIYPLFFFLPGLKRNCKEIYISWVIASIFISQILISPLQHSHYPATHAKKFPFNRLPVELTLVNNFPTNTNPAARRQEVGEKYTWLYFLDDNFLPRTSSKLEKTGFWTRGTHKAEMILKTYYPIKEITFHILNNPRRQNEVSVRFCGEKKKIILGYKEWGSVSFIPKRFFRMNQWIHVYKLSIKSHKIPQRVNSPF